MRQQASVSSSVQVKCYPCTLHWRHNGRDSVSNHQPHDCLLNRLFRRRSKKTSQLRVTGLCVGNSPVTGEFPSQRASNAENVSIWWRHHEFPRHNDFSYRKLVCVYLLRALVAWWRHIASQSYVINDSCESLSPLFQSNPSVAETGLFRENQVNAMAADALATQVNTAAAAMALILSITGKDFYTFVITVCKNYVKRKYVLFFIDIQCAKVMFPRHSVRKSYFTESESHICDKYTRPSLVQIMVCPLFGTMPLQWNLSVRTTSIIRFITCNLFSNVF